MKIDVAPHRTLNSEEASLLGMLIPDNVSNKFDNLVGHVACAQFIIQKHQFIEQSKKDDGIEPTDEKLISLLTSFRANNSNALTSLKTSSEQLLKNFAEEYSRKANLTNFVEPIKKHVDLRTGWLNNVWASIVGAFLYSIIVGIVIFTVTVVQPESKFAKAFRILFVDTTEVPKGN
jgi:hypothetical protein